MGSMGLPNGVILHVRGLGADTTAAAGLGTVAAGAGAGVAGGAAGLGTAATGAAGGAGRGSSIRHS